MRLLFVYDTHEGQTEHIAKRAAELAKGLGCSVDVERIDPERGPNLYSYDGTVVFAPIHVGRHSHRVHRFVRAQRDALHARLSAFVSVSLSAASKKEASRNDALELLDHFLADVGWEPDLMTTAAGAIRYTKYGWLKRLVLQRISRSEDGPTDISRDHELTDWDAIEDFVRRFVDAVAANAADATIPVAKEGTSMSAHPA